MMKHPVDYLPTPDALLRDPSLAYTVELPVLGIVTRFATNSRNVRYVVEEAFGGWRGLEGVEGVDEDRSSPTLRVRVVVHDGVEDGSDHPPVRHLCPDATRVIVHSPGSVGISDPDRRESVAFVTTALVACREQFRSAVLEAITLALVSHFDRHPIHASAIAANGRTVLFAGTSGSGKSTLAYLAHSEGIDVLSDDRVWVQLTPRFRIWGWPWSMHLLPEASAIFPEIAQVGAPSAANGRSKVAIDLGGGASRPRSSCGQPVVCILARGERPGLQRLSPAALSAALEGQLAVGFDRFPERHDAVVHALTAAGGWRLALSDDVRESLPLLWRLLDVGGEDA
jgi:hypothetical protein